MKKILALFILSGLLFSCGGPQKETFGVSTNTFAYDLNVEVDREEITLAWLLNKRGMISGYNIYISEVPLAKKYPATYLPENIKPYNSTFFPGDKNPRDGIEHFTAKDLKDGVKYYVTVRVVMADRSLSEPSNEVVAVCGARSEFELSFRYREKTDGYSFDRDEHVRADDSDNDIYFYAKDGIDYLASPSRLDGFLKNNKLLVLPYKGNFRFVQEKMKNYGGTPSEDRVSVEKGNWVLIKTDKNTHALVQVLDFEGEGEKRKARLYLAYCPLPGEMFF